MDNEAITPLRSAESEDMNSREVCAHTSAATSTAANGSLAFSKRRRTRDMRKGHPFFFSVHLSETGYLRIWHTAPGSDLGACEWLFAVTLGGSTVLAGRRFISRLREPKRSAGDEP